MMTHRSEYQSVATMSDDVKTCRSQVISELSTEEEKQVMRKIK
jgi:hypothetical protein